jgi:hypothetical protein
MQDVLDTLRAGGLNKVPTCVQFTQWDLP